MKTDPKNELTIVRVLDAPRDKVWRACREVEALRQWWGQPEDATMPFCTVDFRVGGALHFGVERPGHAQIWFKCFYRDIVEGELLVLEQHLSDAAGRELDSAEWPASTITLRLEDRGGKTKLTVVHAGIGFGRATIENYNQGWSETLDRLAACLARA